MSFRVSNKKSSKNPPEPKQPESKQPEPVKNFIRIIMDIDKNNGEVTFSHCNNTFSKSYPLDCGKTDKMIVYSLYFEEIYKPVAIVKMNMDSPNEVIGGLFVAGKEDDYSLLGTENHNENMDIALEGKCVIRVNGIHHIKLGPHESSKCFFYHKGETIIIPNEDVEVYIIHP